MSRSLAVRSGGINLIAMNTERRPKSGSGALLATPAPASTALAPHSDTALPRFEATCTPSAPTRIAPALQRRFSAGTLQRGTVLAQRTASLARALQTYHFPVQRPQV